MIFLQTSDGDTSASEKHGEFIRRARLGLKLITTIIVFGVVAMGGVVAKSALFYIVAQTNTATR